MMGQLAPGGFFGQLPEAWCTQLPNLMYLKLGKTYQHQGNSKLTGGIPACYATAFPQLRRLYVQCFCVCGRGYRLGRAPFLH